MKAVFIDSPSSYLLNFGYAFSCAFKSIFGIMTPKPEQLPWDTEYAEITQESLNRALEHAHAMMRLEGWVASAYEANKLDCEDYAFKMRSEIIKYLADNIKTDKKAFPVRVFAYKKENGNGHAVVWAMADGNEQYFDIFPEIRFLTPMKLTAKEVASCFARV